MTTNGAPPPARVQLTPGSWIGIAGIAASVVIAMFAAVERGNARFDGLNVRMDAAHRELRAEIQAVDNRMYALVYDVSYLRAYIQAARGDRGPMQRDLDAMHQDLRVMRTDLYAVRAEFGDGRADPGVVRVKLRELGGDLDLMRGEFDAMRQQLDVPPVRRGWEMP